MNSLSQNLFDRSPPMNDAIFRALCACFALDPDDEAAASLLIPAYQEPEPAPQPPRTRDVIYYYFPPEDEPQSRWQTFSVSSGRPVVSSSLCYKLVLICYGPNCETNAQKVRSFFLLDGNNMPRRILRAAGIYPLPDPAPPMILYEEENSLWRKRADLTLYLYTTDSETYPNRQGMINTPPVVILRK